MPTRSTSSKTDVSTGGTDMREVKITSSHQPSNTTARTTKSVILKGRIVTGIDGSKELMVIADAASIDRKLAIRAHNESSTDSTTGLIQRKRFSF